jgi:SAM-dependent methyltransferase
MSQSSHNELWRKRRSLQRYFKISAYDIPTQDKIPVIQKLLDADTGGLALDIGSGIGYTTISVLGNHPTVCVDLHPPNLLFYCRKITSAQLAVRPLCVVARATALPFKPKTFRFILCSEVLEHLDDDEGCVQEIARLLSDDGRAVVTVPYTGIGFTSFLEFCGLKTVHDFPGPERHVRPGYSEVSLATLLARHGLQLESYTYYLRFFTRLVTDAVSLAHLTYQRVFHRRRVWNWAEVAAAENNFAFRAYTCAFPILWACSRLDRLLIHRRGFGLVAAVTKRMPQRER